MNGPARQRLFLYILIGVLPELISWLTLTYDWSPRGVSIISAKMLLAACITWRAFIDGTGKVPPTPAEPTATTTVAIGLIAILLLSGCSNG